MGYKSDVVIEMEGKAYELMHKALLKLKKSGEYALPIITKDADTYYLKKELLLRKIRYSKIFL